MDHDTEASLRAALSEFLDRAIALGKRQGEHEMFLRMQRFLTTPNSDQVPAPATETTPNQIDAPEPVQPVGKSGRAASGSVKAVVREILEGYQGGGLAPKGIVELGRGRGLALKYTSVLTALMLMKKDGDAVQGRNKKWFHRSRAPMSAGGGRAGGSDPRAHVQPAE